MNVTVNTQFKFASVWLTKQEQNDPNIEEEIDKLAKKYKSQKYKFIVYKSGKRDLVELTKGLLEHNKNLCR